MPPARLLSIRTPGIILLAFSFLLFAKLVSGQGSQIIRGNNSVRPIFDHRNLRIVDSMSMLKNNPMDLMHHGRPSMEKPSILWQRRDGSPIRLKSMAPQDFPIAFSTPLSTVCYTQSGRDFQRQDDLFLYTLESTITRDGNVLVVGECVNYSDLNVAGGFCMKTDLAGNVLWAKQFDSVNSIKYDYILFIQALELRDGSIILAGRTENYTSGNYDFVLSKLDQNGNLVWFKTFASRFWQGFHGSGDSFELRSLAEDPSTGEVYFAGYHFNGLSTITKIDPSDGHILWSNGYRTYNMNQTFGIVINPTELLMFELEYTSSNESYINTTAINKANGDTIFRKQLHKTGDPWALGSMFRTISVVKLVNGHYRMCGHTTGGFEFPVYTGTKDLYHAAIVELDNNFDFVKAWGFKNRLEDNIDNTKISLFPDGSGVFTMLRYYSGFTADVHVSIFKDDFFYHHRKRIHVNEGVPYEPFTHQMTDGGFLNVKMLSDGVVTRNSKIDYYRMHTSDTASLCLGVADSVTSFWYFGYEPASRILRSIEPNLFSESLPKTISSNDFITQVTPACQVISHCDSLWLSANATKICTGRSVTLSIHKNKECGSLVPLLYDSSFVDQVSKIDDSTYLFHFAHVGISYIKASLMGCVLHQDSILIEVLPGGNSLDLGPDTVICPGNTLIINAKKGFASYQWQDGSTDSTFTVRSPGKYFVTATNGCGDSYADTINIGDHPPIPITIGPDRNKCNKDTLRLTATTGFVNYSWAPDYNINSLTGQQVVINPEKDTVYVVAAEKTPGCFAYDTIRVSVRKSPAINLGVDSSVCNGDSLGLNAGSGFQSYQWSTGESSQIIQIKKVGYYSIKATSQNGCISADTIQLISLYNLPRPDLGPDSVLCTGQSRLIHSAGIYSTYLWNTGEVTPAILVNSPGTYRLSVTDRNGCRATDSTVIPAIVNPPSSFLGRDTIICSYANLLLQPNGTFNHYHWNTGATTPSFKITTPGLYWLDVTDKNNCEGRDSIMVNMKDCMTGLFVPSAFTPNGDGLNDLLKPIILGNVKFFRFQVFNRWGEIVFQTMTPGDTWDGNYRGQKQDTNVFVWVCTFQLNGETGQQKSGQVTLIR